MEKRKARGYDETLVTLIWSSDWLSRSGLFEQIKDLASTALSWFDLDEDDHEKIEDAMEREEPEDRFRSIQDLYLQHARRLWHNGKERAGGLHLGNARVGESGCFLPLVCSTGDSLSTSYSL